MFEFKVLTCKIKVLDPIPEALFIVIVDSTSDVCSAEVILLAQVPSTGVCIKTFELRLQLQICKVIYQVITSTVIPYHEDHSEQLKPYA
jgi:hypothetical protein